MERGREETANKMEPSVLYEDKEVLVIDKPAGLVVHSDGKTKEPTLADWILKKYPEIKNVGESWESSPGVKILRPGIVHRLDRDTSGVMLIAKTSESFENLKKQFQNHEVEKTYHAFVSGSVKDDSGVINRPIGRSKKDFRQWSAQRGARGEMREAETHFKVLKRGKDVTHLEIYPKTGRTHQIRVHFKAINHPLVGDDLYSNKKENSLGFDRTALHSNQISWKDLSGNTHSISAPYPEDFKVALDTLQTL